MYLKQQGGESLVPIECMILEELYANKKNIGHYEIHKEHSQYFRLERYNHGTDLYGPEHEISRIGRFNR